MHIDRKMEFDRMIPDRKKAVFFAKRAIPELVCDAVNLEGIDYTLPEVQTLLSGITVGGKKLSDQLITINQAEAWRWLFQLIESGQFVLSKKTACDLHRVAAAEEALSWGEFRSFSVTISGTSYLPPAAEELDSLWDNMILKLNHYQHPLDKAIILFLDMAKTQFFFDVNKRMGRFMMNGLLLSQGYPAINVPAKRASEFHSLMLRFYESHDYSPMLEFMGSCMDLRVVKIFQEAR